MPRPSAALRAEAGTNSFAIFFVMACAITWFLDVPWVVASLHRTSPPDYAGALGALGALGPTLAAVVVVRARRHELRRIFGRWKTHPFWIVLALFCPMAVHLAANLLEVALGGRPAQWFYPPVEPAHVAALVVFSLGEEFGWRGFAYPRLAEQLGRVRAALGVGLAWGIWHLGMLFTPEHGPPHPEMFVRHTVDLVLWSLVLAWAFERGNRSMAVAIAFHAGGHLDNVYRAPESEWRLVLLRFAVLLVVAGLAARSLAQRSRSDERQAPDP